MLNYISFSILFNEVIIIQTYIVKAGDTIFIGNNE